MLFSKNQEKLDAAFLDAVSRHKYKKAKALLKEGADIFAADEEGNTAIHKLASGVLKKGDCDETRFDLLSKVFRDGGGRQYSELKIDEFLCFLINQRLDINAQNRKGETCLHLLVV